MSFSMPIIGTYLSYLQGINQFYSILHCYYDQYLSPVDRLRGKKEKK